MINLSYLSFSDAAKFADIAREVVLHNSYISTFNFNSGINSTVIPRLTPYSISFAFKLFGINDFAVIATSFFYFILSLVFVYLLTNKIYKDKLTSFLSTMAVAFNYNLINYATSGASESPFIFEILASTYFISLRKWWGNVLGIIFIALMFFTRAQAIIYVLGLILFYFLSNFKIKRALIYSIPTIGIISIVYFVLSKQGMFAITQTVTNAAVSDALRGGSFGFNLIGLIKKVFYNLYNFYKAIPEIMNPYLFVLFLIGLFKKQTAFNVTVVFMTKLTFFIAALTIPFYRYLHPVVPFIYIGAVATIVDQFKDNRFKIYITSFLVFFLAIGQTFGILFLDSRFERKTHNIDKAPIYVEMASKLKEITKDDGIILTNLDTWGSWYGERKTIWFPLEPSMIKEKESEIKYIYLTSYKMDDENYYMGKLWREMFNNPDKQMILPHYKFVSEYRFNAEENYEKENGRAVLLERIK